MSQTGLSLLGGAGQRRGITVPDGVSAQLHHFAVQNGWSVYYGGGIANRGTLVLEASTVSHNVANVNVGCGGGLYTYLGALTIRQSAVVGNQTLRNSCGGGGLLNDGRLVSITNSLFQGNTSGFAGGGIFNGFFRTMVLSNSAVLDNQAPNFSGGGIYNDGGSTLIVNNSTLSGNAAAHDGGGLFSAFNVYSASPTTTLRLNSTTLFANTAGGAGGGVVNQGDSLFQLQNTLLAGNSAASSPDCAGAAASLGYNLIGDSSECALVSATGDLLDVDPLLLPVIGDPGYLPLSSASPAINAGNPTGCTDHASNLLTADVRGAPRFGLCDIGAYEYVAPGPPAPVIPLGPLARDAPVNTVFAAPLQVVVVDSLGSPVSDTLVSLVAPVSGSSGTFTATGAYSASVVTPESGYSPALAFLANGVVGNYPVQVSANGVLTPVVYFMSNVARIHFPSVSR